LESEKKGKKDWGHYKEGEKKLVIEKRGERGEKLILRSILFKERSIRKKWWKEMAGVKSTRKLQS